jgi:hypothetical protein
MGRNSNRGGVPRDKYTTPNTTFKPGKGLKAFRKALAFDQASTTTRGVWPHNNLDELQALELVSQADDQTDLFKSRFNPTK